MFRKIAKFAVYIFLIVTILVSSFGVWIATGERHIPFVKEYLEQKISEIIPDYQLDIVKYYVTYDRNKNSFVVAGNNIILRDQQKTRASFEKIIIEFDVGNILTLKFTPKLITVDNYLLNIPLGVGNKAASEVQEAQDLQPITKNTAIEYIDNQAVYKVLHNVINTLGVSQKRDINFRRFGLSNGKIILITHDNSAQTIQLDNVTGNVVSSNNGGIVLVTEVDAKIKDHSLSFVNEILLGQDDIINAKVYFEDLAFSSLVKQIPKELITVIEGIEKSNFSASGYLTFFLSEKQGIEHIKVSLSSKEGIVFLDKLFDQGVEFDDLSIHCSISNNFIKFDCNQFTINIIDNKIYGNFDIEIMGSYVLSNLLLKVDNLEINSLASLWPKIAAKKARQWIDLNIAEGKINHAVAKFKLQDNYLDPSYKAQAIETNIKVNLESSSVKYHKLHEPIYDIDADVLINNHDINVNVKNAKHRNSHIKNAIVRIEDYRNIKELSLELGGNFDGNINDFFQFLKAYMKDPVKILDKEINDIKGKTKGKFNIFIPLQKERLNLLHYKIQGKASDVKIDHIIKDISVTDAEVDVFIDKEKVDIEGIVNIGDIVGHIIVHKRLNTQSTADDKYYFRSKITPQDLMYLGMNHIPYITGEFVVGVAMTMKDGISRIFVKSEFSDAEINIPELGFTKPPKKPLEIELNSYLLPDNFVDIRELKIVAEDIDIKGRAVIDRSHFLLKELIFNHFITNNNDFSLYYRMLNDRMNAKVQGKKIDLSNLKYDLNALGTNNKKYKSIDLIADSIKFRNNVFFSDVNSAIRCNPKHCETILFDAKINGEKELTFALTPESNGGDRSRLILESDNFGGILKAFDLSSNINNGYLRIDATRLISEESGNKVIQGESILRDFSVIKTPILAKLLSLASLNGVVELLNGGGIKFKRFNIPFIVEKNIVSIKNGSGHGNSIGLTIEGSINTAKDELDLQGTVIPAYMVNKVIGEIPLVGGILTGGKDQGVVAVKYDIKGLVSDPDINVNPLSILTPGFMRGVFDVMNPADKEAVDQPDIPSAP